MTYCPIHPNVIAEDCPQCAQYSKGYNEGYAEGAQAVVDGKQRHDNPYEYTNRDAHKRGWYVGWLVKYCELNPRPPELYYKQYKGPVL